MPSPGSGTLRTQLSQVFSAYLISLDLEQGLLRTSPFRAEAGIDRLSMSAARFVRRAPAVAKGLRWAGAQDPAAPWSRGRDELEGVRMLIVDANAGVRD